MLDAVSETTTYPSCFMKKVSEGVWYFDADFIENSMFEIVVTAYAEDGKIYHDKIKVQIPFEENYKVTHKVPVGDNVRGK